MKADSNATSCSEDNTANYKYCIANIYKKRALNALYFFLIIRRLKDSVALRPSSKKTRRSSSMSKGSDAVVNKGGLAGASRGFNPGVGAYFTVCGPISRRQSEPARIHHRVTPRNNFPGHNELLSKPSYLFISPRPLLRSLLRSLSLSFSILPSFTNFLQPFVRLSNRPPSVIPLQLGTVLTFLPKKIFLVVRMY